MCVYVCVCVCVCDIIISFNALCTSMEMAQLVFLTVFLICPAELEEQRTTSIVASVVCASQRRRGRGTAAGRTVQRTTVQSAWRQVWVCVWVGGVRVGVCVHVGVCGCGCVWVSECVGVFVLKVSYGVVSLG